jgi:xanthine/CO dehydrogenase XdhC/CoxF family maturation factor
VKYATVAHGAQFVEVKVDLDLGTIRVTRAMEVTACGKIINPKRHTARRSAAWYRAAGARSPRCALATVVRVEGSVHKRPGARMILTQNGRTTGVISGGCLDGDVRERAVKVFGTGRSVLVKYDTTTDDHIVWGLGLGCNGIVYVFIEPATDEIEDAFDAAKVRGDRCALATVVSVEGPSYRRPGARMLTCESGQRTGPISAGG